MIVNLNMNLMDDKNLQINIVKVGQEFCSVRKMLTNCKRPCYALHFVLFGRGTLIDSTGKKYKLNKGDAFLLYENEKYSYAPDVQDPWSYIWVEFNGEGLDEFLSFCGFEKDNIKKPLKDFNDFVVWMRNMYEAYDASEVQQLRCLAYFMLISGKFIEQEQSAKTPLRDTLNKKQIRNILVYINNNFTMSALSTEMIAQLHGMSVRTLNRLFMDSLGMTPVEYINAYRIAVACEGIQLWKPTSVAEVARWAGFEDEAYFSRVFKNIKGMSPQEYKKRGIDEDPFVWIKEKGMLFR